MQGGKPNLKIAIPLRRQDFDLVLAPKDIAQEIMTEIAANDYALLKAFRGKSSLATYLTVLSGERPVLEWIRGSILRPALDRLDAGEREIFLDTLAAQLAEAYPLRPDGTTLFPFRRLFMIARA